MLHAVHLVHLLNHDLNNVLSLMHVQTCLDHTYKEVTQYFPHVENCQVLLMKIQSLGNSRLPLETSYNCLINVKVNVICSNNLSCTNRFLIILSS